MPLTKLYAELTLSEAQPIFLLDTNTISALLRKTSPYLLHQLENYQDAALLVCDPVLYEIERGLLYRGAHTQWERYRRDVLPFFQRIDLQAVDWKSAGILWVYARRKGKQLSDVDLLIAAMALRSGAIIVTDDRDFAALPARTINWRSEG